MNIQTTKTSSAVRLSNSCRKSEEMITPYRNQRRQFLKEYAGPYYGRGYNSIDPLNLIYSTVSTLVPNLAFTPEAVVTTHSPDKELFADLFALDLNALLDEINVAKTLRMLLIDAVFGMAIAKTALGPSGAAGTDEDGNWLSDPGKVFFEYVSLDDYVPDMTARSREEMAYEGNRFLINYEYALESGIFDNAEIERLRDASNRYRNSSRASDLSRQGQAITSDDEYVHRVELLNLWIPSEQRSVFLPGNPDLTLKYIGEVEWDGPEDGMFDVFGFTPVPDSLIPIPLIGAIYDLYVLCNKIATKIGRQADRQKSFIAVSEHQEEIADSVRDVRDGEVLVVPDASPSGISEQSIGGPSDDNYKAVAWFQDFFNRIGGNLDLMGGLKSMSNTLGQDAMNRSDAGVRVSDWREQCIKSFNSALRKMAHYEITDPVTVRNLTLIDNDFGLSIPIRWSPEAREGELFEKYFVNISTHGRAPMSPEEEMRSTEEWVSNILIPLAQIGGPQGLRLDVAKVAKLTSERRGLRGVSSFFRQGPPVLLSGGSMGGGGDKSPDNRVVRRMPAKPQRVKSQMEAAGLPEKAEDVA